MSRLIVREDVLEMLAALNEQNKDKPFYVERTPVDLMGFFILEGLGYKESFNLVYEPIPTFETRREEILWLSSVWSWKPERISVVLTLKYGKPCLSFIQRLLSKDLADKQRKYDRDYRRRQAAKKKQSQAPDVPEGG